MDLIGDTFNRVIKLNHQLIELKHVFQVEGTDIVLAVLFIDLLTGLNQLVKIPFQEKPLVDSDKVIRRPLFFLISSAVELEMS